jgi:diphosphomevalonate decarboxylase
MSENVFSATMPSNIALIKYMGKIKGTDRNKPTNSSLSLTLPNLLTRVEISKIVGDYDEWASLNSGEWTATPLSDRGRKRYLAHFEFLKQKMGIVGHFLVRSANNFPSDCGIASSASSFAALTVATYELAKYQYPKMDLSLLRLADLSRIGSGSSIRSFLGPIVLWNEQGISNTDIPYKNLIHQVIIVNQEKKAIGSSDAHERVTSSLLFQGRPERAEMRLSALVSALQTKNWAAAFQITWAEFWDMHALFSTSSPAFQYMSEQSLRVLNAVFKEWEVTGDGPLVTMDAGENVHLIYREDQMELALAEKNKWKAEFKVVTS